MAVGAVVARILTQYSDKGSKAAQKDIAKLQKKIDAFGKKALKSFAVAGVAAGAFAIKIGVDAVKGAAADEKAQTALALALRNTTSATEEAIAANTKFLDKLELQVAVDNDELIPALQRLATATGDLGQAQNLLILSTDVAVASGKDLGAVSVAISKAINGQFGALTKLGLPIDATALKQKDLNKILNDFADISQGQASAAANTFSGRLTRLQLSFNQVLDKLGIALMPALTLLVRYIDESIIPMLDSWISKNENELNQTLQNTVGEIKEVVKAFQDIYVVIGAVNAILPFGIGGWIKLLAVLSGISSILTVATAIKKINGQTKILTSAARGSARTVRELKNEMSSIRSVIVRVIQKFQDIGTWAGKTTGRFAILRTGVNALIKRWKVLLGLFTVGIPLLGGLWNKMFGIF
jgi:antitoxin component of RelBE/YafQ-DinJ toxin-antitoxin module